MSELTALGSDLIGIFPVQRDPHLRIVNIDCVMMVHGGPAAPL
jgi:hypothetical protein